MAAQSQWHGNIETSTDTLVPVETLSSELPEEQIRCELSTAVTAAQSKESTPNENGIGLYGNNGDCNRSRILSEIHTKSKALPNGNPFCAMDESILIQPEQQRMEILNGNRNDSNQLMSATAPVPNGNGIVTTMSLYRRRHNSFNSKPPPCIADMQTMSNVRSDSISPNTMNSKFILPNNTSISRTMVANVQPTSIRTINTPSQTTNISMISCPDGLAHALSEQNLRLQQIVHEHKVSDRFCTSSTHLWEIIMANCIIIILVS